MATVFYYAAKFVCGKPSSETSTTAPPLAPGIYYTAINVRNTTHSTIELIRKQFAVALPGEKAGTVHGWFDVSPDLKKDEAMEIDTQDIRNHTNTAGQSSLLKGFAVIKSIVELDVVAVYTAAAAGNVVSIHTERVPPRKLTENWPNP